MSITKQATSIWLRWEHLVAKLISVVSRPRTEHPSPPSARSPNNHTPTTTHENLITLLWRSLTTRKLLLMSLIVLTLGLPIVYLSLKYQSNTQAAWMDDNWAYRQTVNITNSGTAQTDFQVNIGIGTSALINAGKMKSDCSDIRVTDNNGKILPYWIEPTTCNNASNNTKVWVKVPSISTSGAPLYVYYGNPSANSTQSATTQVFIREISNVQGAWDLDESSWTNNCSTGSILDSSGNGSNGKSCPNGTGPTGGATGKFGYGGSFDGDNDYVNAGTNASLNPGTGDYTIAAWIKASPDCTSTGVCRIMCGTGNTTNQRLHLNVNGSGYLDFRIYDGTVDVTGSGTTNVADNIWHYAVVTFDRDGHGTIYLDGTINGTPTSIATANRSIDFGTYLLIGSEDTWRMYKGSLDQVRTYNKALSQAEISDLYGTGGDRQGYTTANYANKELVRKYSSSVSVGSPTNEEKSQGPAAYWKFDEGYGTTAYDSTANGNNGSFGAGSSAPTWQTEDQCISGKCLSFDGSNDYVDLTNNSAYNFTSTNSWTLSAWIKTSTSADNAIISRMDANQDYKGYEMMVGGSNGHIAVGLISAWSTNNTHWIESTNTVNDGKWHHVVFTYDGSETIGGLKIYRDGNAETPITIKSGFVASSAIDPNKSVKVGARTNNTGIANPFNGSIDEVKIYPYARTAAQIKSDYAAGLAHASAVKGISASMGSNAKNNSALSDGLIGYWKMDEASWNGTPGEVIDSSGNANHGAGSTAATAASGKFGNGGNFGGANRVSVGTSTTLNPTNFTIAMWIYYSSANEIIQKSGAYGAKISGGKFTGYRWGGAENHYTVSTVPTNQWTFLVATYDGQMHKTYFNGALEASESDVASAPSSGSNLCFGGACGSYMTGRLDEVRVYNRALSPKEVRDLYNWAPGPVGYWNFEDGSGGTAKDTSGNSNNGTISGATFAAGKYGKTLSFDGIDDSVSAGDSSSLDFTGGFSMSYWAKFNDVSTEQWLVSKGGGWNRAGFFSTLGISSGTLRFGMGNGSSEVAADNGGFATNTWYHISMTYDGTTMRVYKNGVLLPNTNTNAYSYGNDYAVNIGRSDNGGQLPFNGQIDDVRIYNYARTQKQIVEDMNAGHPGVGSPVASAIGHWKFDEGYGSTAHNSGNGGSTLDGSLAGSTAPTWTTSGKFGKALSFNGSSTFVDLGNNTAYRFGTGDFSASFWMRPTAWSGYTPPLSNSVYSGSWDGFHFEEENGGGCSQNGVIRFDVAGTIICSTSVLSANNWYYISGVRKDGVAYIYINGVLENSGTAAGNVTVNRSLYVGRNPDATYPRYFNGIIDEVKVYNYALTEDEVKLDYNHGSSLVLGSTSTDASGNPGDNSSAREYCVPGDTSTCNPLAGEWTFNEKVGTTAYDSSGNGYNGSLTGSASWTNGKIGAGVYLTTANTDFVRTSQTGITGSNQEMTIEAWAKATNWGAQGHPMMVAKGVNQEWILWQDDDAAPSGYAFRLNGTGCSEAVGTSTARNNQWQHIVGTFSKSAGILRIYVDGRLEGEVTGLTGCTPNSGTREITFGVGNTGTVGSPTWANGFTGWIDHVRIYNYARTPVQIAWDYNRGAPVGHWKFDEGQGTTANDATGNGNNGNINIGGSGSQTTAGTVTAPTDGTGAWYNGRNGKLNYSLNLDGTDDYVDAGNDNRIAYLPNGFSVSLWINPTSWTCSNHCLVAAVDTPGAREWGLWSSSTANGRLRFYVIDPGGSNYIGRQISSASIPVLSTWSHVTVTWDGSTSSSGIKVYVNGVRTDDTDFNSGTFTGITDSNTPLTIGYGYGNQYFNGKIDDARIYNYALTPAQIKTLYNNGAAYFGPQTGSP